MLFWSFLLLPMILANVTERRIDNYIIKVKENSLESIHATGESSNELDLSDLGIEAINRNAFDNLPQLKSLILANNSLAHFPEFVFMNLTNLERLSLADNKIIKFENVFVGLNNLKFLNISNNPIKLLGTSYLYGLTKSSEIFTRGNSLLSISTALFENPFLRDDAPSETVESDEEEESKKERKKEAKGQVKNLRLKICKQQDSIKLVDVLIENEPLSNDCQEIETDLRDNKLSLNNLGIKKFDKGWYRLQAPSITTLNLAGNKIASLTSELLNDLPANIKIVNLSGNKIKRLEKGTIRNNEISTLDLGKNLIRQVDDGAFEATQLIELCLKGNRLNDTKLVASLPLSIRTVNLEKNEIRKISVGSFSRETLMRKLSLYGNKITELTKQSLVGFYHLENLDLSNNRIRKIEPQSFRDLKSLLILNLRNNSIASLNEDIFFGLNTLEVLDLGRNKLTSVKNIRLVLPPTLDRLRLDHNEIDRLVAKSFVAVPRQTLSLNGNKISKIEQKSFYLPTLSTLRLDDNLLKKLDGESFVGMKNLRHLVLESNGIAKINKGFAKNLGNLDSLSLSKNPIKKLKNGDLYGLSKLQESSVYLAGVPLEIIQGGLFENV